MTIRAGILEVERTPHVKSGLRKISNSNSLANCEARLLHCSALQRQPWLWKQMYDSNVSLLRSKKKKKNRGKIKVYRVALNNFYTSWYFLETYLILYQSNDVNFRKAENYWMYTGLVIERFDGGLQFWHVCRTKTFAFFIFARANAFACYKKGWVGLFNALVTGEHHRR